jgi:hypothetical protein
MRFPLLSAAAAVLVLATACGSSPASSPRSAASPTPDEATLAYVALIRAYWADLHVADVTSDGSDVDAKACLGEVSPTSPSDVHVLEPVICRPYALATLAANEKFLAKLDTVHAPAKFAADDRVFRMDVPKAISDLNTLIAACAGPNRQAIIDDMWAYARDMIPDMTNALDNVDPSVTHLDPSGTQSA